MTIHELLGGWAILVVLLILIVASIPKDDAADYEESCPPHIWPLTGPLICTRCGQRPAADD